MKKKEKSLDLFKLYNEKEQSLMKTRLDKLDNWKLKTNFTPKCKLNDFSNWWILADLPVFI